MVRSRNGTDGGFIRVGTLEELKTRGIMVVPGELCSLLVIHDGGRVYGLDNRCPHLGFPLHRGSVKDNVLTCHWHHARFDLASGCTFDLWADDIPTAAVEVPSCRRPATEWIMLTSSASAGSSGGSGALAVRDESAVGLLGGHREAAVKLADVGRRP